ncbi:MAG: 16S rRNA (guanine(527)-N(7))-methyltransferase RsmG [Kyrpidia sp.]|nr:16S rRNA (guanine(527)-N(7))-methyltransferase RsmG [Kyrpidia sp.]
MDEWAKEDLARRVAEALEKRGIHLDDGVWANFSRYYDRLVEENRSVNLTAITDLPGVYWKHFYDSLVVLGCAEVAGSGSFVDVGSGAGFPGLAIAIARRTYSASLLDALEKRVRFLQGMCRDLGLEGVRVVHGRAEDYGRDARWRERYDVAVARAVAGLAVLVEYLLPFVRVGGVAVAWKGPDGRSEAQDAVGAIRRLGGEVEAVHGYELPGGMGTRTLVVIRKTGETPPVYPRRAGVPEKRPLG